MEERFYNESNDFQYDIEKLEEILKELESKLSKAREALERIGCRMEHGDEEPCPIYAEVDKALKEIGETE